MFTQPNFLQRSDLILIVAPAGIIKQKEAILKAKAQFEQWGFTVELGEHVFAQNGHFAGTDEQRKEDMQWALNHPTAKAIWCARGGYGCVRIVDDLDFSKFAQQPKWLIGYSDFTVFHQQVHRLGIQSIHGAMPINFKQPWSAIEESMEALKNTLIGKKHFPTPRPHPKNKIGNTSGTLIGGNLTLIQNQIGSTTAINPDGTILFIEEIGEYKYRIDRLLRSIDRTGYFKQCKGVLVGGFSLIKANDPVFGHSMEALILDILKPYAIPVVFDIPAGHEDRNLPLIFGAEIQINCTMNQIHIDYLT